MFVLRRKNSELTRTFKLVANGEGAIREIDKMSKGLVRNAFMINRLQKEQIRIIESRVKRFFRNNVRRKPTTIYSKDHEYVGGLGKFTEQIINNIDTFAFSNNQYIIVAGTGVVSLLDRSDPIHQLTNPRRILNSWRRIWRFLEAGVPPNIPIKARTKKSLAFDALSTTNAGVVIAKVFKEAVIHPGYKGRNAFYQAGTTFGEKQPYRNDFKMIVVARQLVRIHMKKYSAE